MLKTITIKLMKASPASGTFTIKDQFGNIIADDVPKDVLIRGISYNVEDNVAMVTLSQQGKCKIEKTKDITVFTQVELSSTSYVQTHVACLWQHLIFNKFNHYYGNTEPYCIEYPNSYQFQDEILQNVVDYTKVYKYLDDSSGVFSYANKIELDNVYFNQMICYNGQQSTGILELEPKPLHNLNAYMKYPIYRSNSKVITFTKSDNFYQTNNFVSIVKDKTKQLFITSCESLSVDKIVNQENMDYSYRSFNKAQIRAKELKTRFILNNRSDVHLVSQFIVSESMISYK